MMPNMPGLNADVYFGDAEQPLPDWRLEAEQDSAEEPEDELDEDRLAMVRSMLGFDPDESNEGEPVTPPIPPSPFHKSLASYLTKEQCRWVTMPANGPGGGGSHVCIDGAGEIHKGPKGTTDKKPNELGKPGTSKKPAASEVDKPSPFKPQKESETAVKIPAQPSQEKIPKQLPKGKKPKAKIVGNVGVTAANKKSVVKSFFGKTVDDGTLAAIANAVDGATVRMSLKQRPSGKSLYLSWFDEGVDAGRSIFRDKDGKLVVHNDIFIIENSSKHKGKGVEFFLNQVQALRDAGVNRIETHAAGNAKDEFNGYYTWPRMGYDGTMTDEAFDRLPSSCRESLGKSRSVLDLFELPGGKEAWKEHGGDIFDATFDLNDDSRSMKVLAAYLEERKQRGK